MRCDAYNSWLSAYLDGELAGHRISSLEGHLSQCPRCAQELAELRSSLGLLRTLTPEEPPPTLRPRIMAALKATRPSPWAWLATPFRFPTARLATGLAVMAAGVTLVGLVVNGRPTGSGRALPMSAGDLSSPRAPALHPDAVASARNSGLGSPLTHRSSRETAIRLPKPATTAPPTAPSTLDERESAPKPAVDLRTAERPQQSDIVPGPLEHHPVAKARSRRTARGTTLVSRAATPQPRGSAPSAPAHPRVTSSELSSSTPPEDTLPAPTIPPVPELDFDEPTTMMASMPMEAGDAPVTQAVSGEDPLNSLRQRLAEQRRKAPSAPIETGHHNARFWPPVRIEF